jgi:hypothetical protein
MAAVWHGGLDGADQYEDDSTLLSSVRMGMTYWFGRDFNNTACLDYGGTTKCPCSNADNSLWNTNWFSNVSFLSLCSMPGVQRLTL